MSPRLAPFCFLLLVVVVGVGPVPTHGQDTPDASTDSTQRGVVWAPPAEAGPALETLGRIDAAGATAVRLTRIPPELVFRRADSLGLHLYVDLPVSYVPASTVADSLAAAAGTFQHLRRQSEKHPSLTAVGLARYVDTTVPESCDVLADWSQKVDETNAPLLTYYVTPFRAEADRCAGAVDQVLINVQGRTSPVERWRTWRDTASNADVGALGTWTTPGASDGLRVPHSQERQARYLENALSRFLGSEQPPPSAVFVFRWKDEPDRPLPSRRFGLHTLDQETRPAARVVRGIYTGEQRVFAFPEGTAPWNAPYGLILFSWGLMFLLGALYAREPFIQRTLGRYFSARGFYRDAVRQGRDLRPWTNGILLGLVAFSFGLTATAGAYFVGSAPATDQVLSALPSDVRGPLTLGLRYPELMGAVLSGLVLWIFLLWTTVLVWLGQRYSSFSVPQGLVLVTWPCWPLLLPLPIALVAAAHPPIPPVYLAMVVGAGLALALIYHTVRVLLDYRAVAGLPWYAVVPLAVLSPFSVFGAVIVFLVAHYNLPLAFLWRLAVLT